MTISRVYDDVVLKGYHCKATIPVYKGPPPKTAGPAAIIIDMQVSLYHQYTFHILILHTHKLTLQHLPHCKCSSLMGAHWLRGIQSEQTLWLLCPEPALCVNFSGKIVHE